MPLSLRKRGTLWYVRGQVKVGKKSLIVDEHSTGLSDEDLAGAYLTQLEAEKQHELIFGAPPASCKISFAEAAVAYVKTCRHDSDVTRVAQLRVAFEHMLLSEIDAVAFATFVRNELPGRSPNTHERIRVTLARIFKAVGVKFPDIPSYGDDKIRVRWLSQTKADWFMRWYADHARPIALIARSCGLRASENILMEVGRCDPSWGAHGGFHVAGPKNGRDRVVPWTAEVRVEVLPRIRLRRDSDRLWLTPTGQPYRDTRLTGGNPIRRVHETACRDAGVDDFTFHDWRHHWATWALQKPEKGGLGWDLLELQKVGGWANLESVQKYAAVMQDSIEESFENVGTRRAVA